MKKVNVYYDGYGLINERGTSKYWGVSIALTDTVSKWRLQLNIDNGNYTFHFKNHSPTEREAGNIAAHLWQFRGKMAPSSFIVKSYKGNMFVFSMVTKTITLIDESEKKWKSSLEVVKFDSTGFKGGKDSINLFDIEVEKKEVKPGKPRRIKRGGAKLVIPNRLQDEFDKLTPYEQSVVELILEGWDDDEISDTGLAFIRRVTNLLSE